MSVTLAIQWRAPDDQLITSQQPHTSIESAEQAIVVQSQTGVMKLSNEGADAYPSPMFIFIPLHRVVLWEVWEVKDGD